MPLGDSLALRIAAASNDRDGDIKNIYSKATTSHVNNRDSGAYRTFYWHGTQPIEQMFYLCMKIIARTL